MKLSRLKMISSNSLSKSSPLWKSRDNNDWSLQQWKSRRRISESIPFQIPGSDFPRSVFRSRTRQKDFTRVFMQSETLYVINTAEGNGPEREVEEEKTGIMRQQPVGSTTLRDYSQQDSYESIQEYTYSCPTLWLGLWVLVKSALMCLLPTHIHIRLCQKNLFSEAVQVERIYISRYAVSFFWWTPKISDSWW